MAFILMHSYLCILMSHLQKYRKRIFGGHTQFKLSIPYVHRTETNITFSMSVARKKPQLAFFFLLLFSLIALIIHRVRISHSHALWSEPQMLLKHELTDWQVLFDGAKRATLRWSSALMPNGKRLA